MKPLAPWFSRAKGQEGAQQVGIAQLPGIAQRFFERTHIGVVQLRLHRRIQIHEKQVSDQVGVGQIPARRIYGLVELRSVIDTLHKADCHNHEFLETSAQGRNSVRAQRLYLPFEIVKIGGNAVR